MVKKQLELAKKLRFIQDDVNCIIPSKYRDPKRSFEILKKKLAFL